MTPIFRSGTFGGQIPYKTTKIIYLLFKKIFQWGLCIYFLGNMKEKFIQNLSWLWRYGLEQVVNCIFCNLAYFLRKKYKLWAYLFALTKLTLNEESLECSMTIKAVSSFWDVGTGRQLHPSVHWRVFYKCLKLRFLKDFTTWANQILINKQLRRFRDSGTTCQLLQHLWRNKDTL